MYLSRLFAIILTLIPVSLSITANPSILTVFNKTKDKIAVIYELPGAKEPLTQAVAPAGSADIQNPEKATSLIVLPYGDVKKWFSKTTLGFKPENLIGRIESALGQNPALHHAILTVSLGVLGTFGPYHYEITLAKEPKQELPASRILQDAFPGVVNALEKGFDIVPRYVLGLPADASQASIENAYKTLSNRWQAVLQEALARNELNNARFIKDILEYINLAYNALRTKDEAAFKKFTLNKIHTFSRYPEDKS